MNAAQDSYRIEDRGSERVLIVGDKEYPTRYSVAIIKGIIQRKGIGRAPQYLRPHSWRTDSMSPVIERLNDQGLTELKVLEVGCSSGHVTEYLQDQPCVGEIQTYDVDRAFVEITRLKVEHLGLDKVVRVDALTELETRALPYPDNYFDLVLVNAVVEHLPLENRYEYVDAYYRKLAGGGLICFFDTPNRAFPKEFHTIGMPFIQWLPPQMAFILVKIFKRKRKGLPFTSFVRCDTGWRGATYHECLPRTTMIDLKDVTEEYGAGWTYWYARRFTHQKPNRYRRLVVRPTMLALRFLARKIGFPPSFFLPNLNLVFRKGLDYQTQGLDE